MSVSVFVPPKKSKPKPKPKKPVSSEAVLFQEANSEYLKYLIGGKIWLVKNNGELLISSAKEHWFKCFWSSNGTIYATLYPDMRWYEKKLKQILSMQASREWLAKNSKRPVEISLEVE